MIGNDWDYILKEDFESDYFKGIISKVEEEYKDNICYPPKDLIFNALKLTPYSKVKVVIVGQDPYHGEGEAMGLSFSVNEKVKMPPSLKNIYKELYSDLNIKRDKGDLTGLALEGVLFINSILTVRKDNALSHKNIGWERFTDKVIKVIDQKDEPVVFILWGNFARSKKDLIKNPKHLVIESAHPSPFSAHHGFFGSKPFSKCNKFLEENGALEIDWSRE